MCVVRVPDRLNALLHTWHLYGFSPLWILLCVARCPACVNRSLQTVHSNGLSPEWLRLCVARCLSLWKHLPHSVHLYLLVWIFLWLHRAPLDENRFSHWVHEYTFSPVCFFSVFSHVTFRCKPFVTHCTHIRSWLVIMWMFSDIITDSFSRFVDVSFTCKYTHYELLFWTNRR